MLAIVLMVFGWGVMQAQSIGGVVHDDKGEPLPYATVKVLSLPDSTIIVGGVTRDDGTFSLELRAHTLPVVLEASLIGYATERKQCTELEGHKLVLSEEATLLEEVSITASRIRHKLIPGGISTSIDSSPLAHLSNIYGVLRGVPLVEIEGEEVRVTGKGKPVIYINDRLMSDPNQLRNLKPYLIKDIQVITNPGARYSSSAESVIKIYTKREEGRGLSGEVQVELYDQIGSPLSYLPSARFNYRFGKWDLFASALYQDKSGNHSLPSLQTEGRTPTSEWVNTSDVTHRTHFNVQEYTVGINYEDELQSAGLRYRIESEKENSSMATDMMSRKEQLAAEPYLSLSTTVKPWITSHRPNLYYLRQIGDWTAQIDLDYYGTAMGHSVETVREGHTDQLELRQVVSEHGAKYQSVGMRLDTKGPLWGGHMELGGEYSWVNNKFYNKVDDQLKLTNLDSRIHEQLFTLYLQYSRKLAEHWDLTAGLRMEHLANEYLDQGVVDPNKSRNDTNFFPAFSLAGRLWGVNAELSFRSKIERPTYWQLQPQYRYISRYEYQVGDPTLRPAIDYSTALTLNRKWLTMTLSHTYSKDCLTPDAGLLPDREDPSKSVPYVTVLRTINAAPHHGLSAMAVASPTIGWWKPSLTLSVSKMYGYNIWHFDEYITYRKPTLGVALANTLTLPEDITMAFNVRYVPFGNEDNVEYRSPILTSYGEISKKWLKEKNLLTTISATNIFNTSHTYRVASRYSVMEAKEYAPPRITFTISYRFNTGKNNYKGTGALGSVIERM